MATKKKTSKAKTIRRGSCRVVRGKTRICATKSGRLYMTTTKPKRRKSTTKKRKSTTKKKTTRKLKKPVWCKTAPKKSKGMCYCTTKTGKKKRLRKAYCTR